MSRKFAKIDIKLSSYNYVLPENYIAQTPTLPEHNAKLLICKKNGENYIFEDHIFGDLPDFLDEDTVIFFNETKVFKGRFVFENAWCRRKSGKELAINGEIFVYQIHGNYSFEALVSDDKNYKAGNIIEFKNGIILKIVKLTNDGILFEIEGMDIFSFLEKHGQMPLPPYIEYGKDKEKWYQTNFARKLGSAAAPTASLHFTEELLTKLREKNIAMEFEILHVGLGTFRPVYCENILEHKIHGEELLLNIEIFEKIMKYKKTGKKILAVGTTMSRFLESLPYIWKILEKNNMYEKIGNEVKEFRNNITEKISLENAEKIIFFLESGYHTSTTAVGQINYKIQTKLFIYPGFKRQIVDKVITNFHLPKSSLLMLVASWMGRENMFEAYGYAIKNNYRFYSFGDGMLIIE